MDLVYAHSNGGQILIGNAKDAELSLVEFRSTKQPKSIDALVLCAQEDQLRAPPGMLGLRVLLDDRSPLGVNDAHEMVRKINAAGDWIARLVTKRAKVLVTCHEGRNRSAVCAGDAILKLSGLPGDVVVDMIRRARPATLTRGPALSNVFFEKVLLSYVR